MNPSYHLCNKAVLTLAQNCADMTDWGTTDQLTTRQAATAVPNTPFWIIGHSLGAMMLPIQRLYDGVTRVIGIASGIVHYTDHP